MMSDEVFRSEFHFQEHTQELTHKLTQPTEDIILQRNAELRKNPGVIKDLGAGDGKGGIFGRQVASIPLNLWEWAVRNGYELNSGDNEHRSKELFRFLKSEKGQTCIVQEGNLR